MQNILSDLKTALEKDDRLMVDGQLLKNKVIELSLKLDKKLLSLLLKNKIIKKHFFQDIDGVLVFDKIKFMKFVSNKSFLPDSYTSFKNKIGLAVDDEYLKEKNDVVLVWPYKDCVLEGAQTKEEEKRDEIFWNETLAPDQIDRLLDPKVLTNFKKYDKTGEHKVSELKSTDNLIVKGNNLLALHSLEKKYREKIKLIYIDPPYNTGGDSFGYNDNFNHSTWLTFMKNRVEIAKDLLKEDGVLCVQCNDDEQAYLKVLLDEVMGADQFEVSFYVQVRYDNKTLSEDNDFQKVMEIVHVYSKKHTAFVPNKLKEEYSLDKFQFEINELKKGKVIEVHGKKVEIFKQGEYEINKVKSNIDALKETWATGGLIRQGGTAAEFLSKYLIPRKDGLNILYKVYGMGNDELGFRYITGPKKKTAFRGKFYSGVPKKIKSLVQKGDFKKEKSIPNLFYNYLKYEGDFGNCRHEGGVNIKGGKKTRNINPIFYRIFYR